ncbi:MAG: methionyl-tRNA formyltransferase [SAR202 cluster bacterium]|nr:methionyl-tRNA formyltransferase [Chloroflexota bacterium]MQG21879.1 methionyl-tRNA formyltransferase [SAR202 cluster bacterium]
MKIVFMGTPDYSASILENLISSDNDVVGVLTKPDKPHGRNKKILSTPVKQIALDHNIPLFQPRTFKNNEPLINSLIQLDAEIGIVVAYGLILPNSVLTSFPLGCLNIHPSLLPKYRGPSPIATSILNGDKTTGITIIKLNSGIDSGPILNQKEVSIIENENCGALTTRLFNISSDLIINVIKDLEAKTIISQKQSEQDATYTEKLTKSDGLIDWNLSAIQIFNMIRAYHPWPGAYTYLNNKKIKIIESQILSNDHLEGITPGKVLVDKQVLIGTGEGILNIIKVQPEGKSIMNATDFSNGNPNFNKSILGNT